VCVWPFIYHILKKERTWETLVVSSFSLPTKSSSLQKQKESFIVVSGRIDKEHSVPLDDGY